MPQMANVGARNENVPPWTSGRRFPHVVCISVVIPLTKNIVPISHPSSMGLPESPRGSLSMSGMATVEPNMVK